MKNIKIKLSAYPPFSYFKLFFVLLFVCGILSDSSAQQASGVDMSQAVAPKILPGKGLQEFDFFYAGEGKSHQMYIVRKGKITWSYIDTIGKGEISDAILMAMGTCCLRTSLALL